MSAIVLTNTGRSELVKRLIGLASGGFITLGAGTGTGTPARTDTTLFTDVSLWANGIGVAQTVTSPNDTLSVTASLTAGGSVSIRELGLAVDSLHTQLAVHATLDQILTLISGDVLIPTITLTFS